MQQSKIENPYENAKSDRLQQGDIYRDVSLVEWAHKENDAVVTKLRELPHVVVLSQDCDLDQDFRDRADSASGKHDKYLQAVLLCPAYQSTVFKSGEHLQELGLAMQVWGGPDWKRIIQNQHYRYHYLEAFPDLQIPELIIDFKHYITAPRDVLYRPNFKINYLGTISELYRENLSGRFAYYLSRIALPEPTDS